MMLQSLQKYTNSLVAKILLGILMLSFGVFFGMGDWVRRFGSDPAVITVGGIEISAFDFKSRVQKELDRFQQAFGTPLAYDQARQLGIIETILNSMVTRLLLNLEAERLGLTVDEAMLRQYVQSQQIFKNEEGVFDIQLFRNLLKANHMTEAQYLEAVKEDLVRLQIYRAISFGAPIPTLLAKPLFKHGYEERMIDQILLNAEDMKELKEPTIEELKAFYEAHQDLFIAPEYRAFSVLSVVPAELNSKVVVSDQELKELYNANPEAAEVPEQRFIQHIDFISKEAALKAQDALNKGENFLSFFKKAATKQNKLPDLGWVSASQVPASVGEAIFKLKSKQATQPIQTQKGWSIFYVEQIKPAYKKPFSEMKESLREEYLYNARQTALSELSQKIDDGLAGGKTFEEVGKDLDLRIIKVGPMSAQGQSPKGEKVLVKDLTTDMIDTAFSLEDEKESPIIETEGGGLYMVRIEEITPSAVEKFESIQAKVRTYWLEEKAFEKVHTIAQEAVKVVNEGKSLNAFAQEKGLKVQRKTLKPLGNPRNLVAANMPASLVAALYSLEPSKATLAPNEKGFIVMQLIKVLPVAEDVYKKHFDYYKAEATTMMDKVLFEQFVASLQNVYPVKIQTNVLDSLFKE